MKKNKLDFFEFAKLQTLKKDIENQSRFLKENFSDTELTGDNFVSNSKSKDIPLDKNGLINFDLLKKEGKLNYDK